MALGDRMRQRRLEKGLGAIELARLAQLSKGYVSDLERGRATRPSADVLARLAGVLGTTVPDLLEQETPTVEPVVPAPLRHLAEEEGLTAEDVRTLAGLRWRGEQPGDLRAWRFLLEAIRRAMPRRGDA